MSRSATPTSAPAFAWNARVTTRHTERVESPCVRNCTLDEDDICIGCLRSIDEICAWGGASENERRTILQQVALRREARSRRV